MVALARDVRPSDRPCVYHDFLRRMDDDERLRRIRAHHAECIRVIDARLGELRPASWDRRQWSDFALSVGFGGMFAFWLCMVGWLGQCVWSWLAD